MIVWICVWPVITLILYLDMGSIFDDTSFYISLGIIALS